MKAFPCVVRSTASDLRFRSAMRSRVCGLSEVRGLRGLDTEAGSPGCLTKSKSKSVPGLGAVTGYISVGSADPAVSSPGHPSHPTGSGTGSSVPAGRVSICYLALALLRRFGKVPTAPTAHAHAWGPCKAEGSFAGGVAIKLLFCRHVEATSAPGLFSGMSEQVVA